MTSNRQACRRWRFRCGDRSIAPEVWRFISERKAHHGSCARCAMNRDNG